MGGLDRAESGALGKVLMASRYFVYKHFYCNCVPVVVWYEKICLQFLNLLGIFTTNILLLPNTGILIQLVFKSFLLTSPVETIILGTSSE